MEFHEKLIRLRKKQGLTQQELADALHKKSAQPEYDLWGISG